MAEKTLLDDPSQQPFLVRFTTEEVNEIKKVEWPSRRDTRNLTVVVLALSAVLAASLGLIDLILTALYTGLRTLFGA
jgi:preprotein translocase SecE subunit